MTRPLAALLMLALSTVAPALAAPPQGLSGSQRPVKVIADQRLSIGVAQFPLYVSGDWSMPLPDIHRAVLILHGYERNADSYFHTGLMAEQAAGTRGAGTLIIAPQFLDLADAAAHPLPANLLRWRADDWAGGAPAASPVQISSYAVLDAIIQHLSDRHLFPDLNEIVVAGHSGGGQVVQRYAILARTQAPTGIHIRYVVANPSSYAWFGPARPEPAIAAACPGYNRWKYGMNDLPAYAANANVAALEQAFVTRTVTYLLGTADIDPNHPALDKTCMAEAQGPTRYARGHAYFAALQRQFGPALHQTVVDVPGAGHSARRMFDSPAGVTALFADKGPQ